MVRRLATAPVMAPVVPPATWKARTRTGVGSESDPEVIATSGGYGAHGRLVRRDGKLGAERRSLPGGYALTHSQMPT